MITQATASDALAERTAANGRLQTVLPRLHVSAPHRLPFGRELDARAFLLERDQGNVLIYSAVAILPHLDEVEALGGIARQYLNHSHEATPAADTISERFGARLIVHAADASSVAETARVSATFSRRHRLDADLEVIPVPGHTAGATAYLWDTGAHRVLFTGDTLFLADGGWRGVLFEHSSDRAAYIASLELLCGLEFDLLVPGIATAGRPWHAFTDGAEATERIGVVVERLRAGDDH